jgi:tetratricopeptide (TPR) repeat protein
VQPESGQRTIERRITEAEKKSENEPEYWRERALYYRGRHDFEKEEQALKKALLLTKPLPRPERASKGYADLRALALADYARGLARQGREKEAAVLLRREIAEAPATATSSEQAAYLLAFYFNKQLSVEDDALWNWLANRAAWGYTEERLLWRMLENASPETLDRHFTRAEKLVTDGTPARAYTLGWIMNRMRFPKRSLPLLKAAVEKAPDEEQKQRANFALLESYLDSGAWKEAEGIFPKAWRQLTAREIQQWHSRLALLAARDGSKADALRLWCRTANLTPTAISGLAELAGLGLHDDLVAFYRAMQKEMPESHAPARAFVLLETISKSSHLEGGSQNLSPPTRPQKN